MKIINDFLNNRLGNKGRILEQRENAVKTQSNTNSGDNINKQGSINASNIISKLGFKPTTELQAATKTLVENDVPINKDTLKNVEDFLSKTAGNISHKLDTIKTMANKGIEFTASNLESVHEAIHGEEYEDVLSKIAEKFDSEFSDKIKSKTDSISQDLSIKEALHDIKEILTSNQDLGKISRIINEKISDKDIAEKLQNVLNEAKYIMELGNKEEGLLKLSQILDQIDGQLFDKDLSNFLSHEDLNSIHGLEQVLSSMDSSSKAFIMTKITKEMGLAASKFKDLKREVIRNIDTMTKVANSTRSNVHSQLKGMLEKSIDILDKAILKSEITLYTDMKTEKQLIEMSSSLAKARSLLSKGKNSEAAKIFDSVKGKLMKLNWKPSQNKIIHSATKESMFSKKATLQNNFVSNLSNTLNNLQNQQASARNTFDIFRALGLNYESEAAQKLAGNLENLSKQDLQKNLKAIMLNLTEGEGKASQESSTNQQIVKAINNLTGQQLLSKQDSNPHEQSMFFNIPLNVEGNLENVKLFVNGRKNNDKIDWENASLYFLIDTKKMGATGIKISSIDRNLSVTIKNDNKNLEGKVKHLSENLKNNLEKVGYNVIGLKFTDLNEKNRESNNEVKAKNEFVSSDRLGRKGFDLKI